MIYGKDLDRFWKYVEKTDSCWLWIGPKTRYGYGTLLVKDYNWTVHRLCYMLVRGLIPEGLKLDHLCRNRACVNPDHLEAVTLRENSLRGAHPNYVTCRTGMCKRGHSMDDACVSPSGKKECRKCKVERRRKRYLTFGPERGPKETAARAARKITNQETLML